GETIDKEPEEGEGVETPGNNPGTTVPGSAGPVPSDVVLAGSVDAPDAVLGETIPAPSAAPAASGETLPFTGADPAPIALIGLLLILAGWVVARSTAARS
ncbi:MAG: hypothetical protein QOH26_2208, partial [Actinomycetota bacterium]|nr:hypothetical protein [Actinomycetota bacterium]